MRRDRGDLGRLTIATLAGALALTGCGSGGGGSVRPSARSTPTSHTSASPVQPTAADGTDLTACADGTCEVRVGAPVNIAVPRRLQVSSVQVRSVGPDTVRITGRFLGNRQGGFCTGRNCSSSGSGEGFTLTLGADSTGSENGLSITAVAIKNGLAVLRLAPFSGG